MAEYHEFLAALSSDPGNDRALSKLEAMAPQVFRESEAASALKAARKTMRERGQLEIVARLFDLEINASDDETKRADLLLAKGHLYADDLLNEQSAVECFNQVLQLRPGDEAAQETLAHIDLVRENWQRIVDKYLEEAQVSTDRQLTTSLYLSAAETCARYQPDSGDVEQHLRKALEVDPRNRRAAIHLERRLRKEERWEELVELLEQRVDAAVTQDERIQALIGLADIYRGELDAPNMAADCMKKVVAIEPSHPRALRVLSDAYEQLEDWSALVMLYTNALKAQRRARGASDLGMLLQIAMLHWRRLENPDAAEEYFRRIRKAQPAHPAALDFYRAYYPSRNETSKLLQVLRQAQKGVEDEEEKRKLSVEIAELAETQLGNPEKAIDSWKSILRANPDAQDARDALQRLYRKTEKWNALLDMMKDEVEHLPEDDVDGRVARLMEIVAIYRDRLKLDVMVINTYNSILKVDPYNEQALADLVEKYKQLGRWNDLINVLNKKAESPRASVTERADILREIAALWSERFGNFAQAIKPLERLLELVPSDTEASGRLKDIYTRRRQWRALIALHEREVAQMAIGDRRIPLADMARLASDRLGDQRLAIEIWNRILELPGFESDDETLASLAQLYEREKRYLALADIYQRQREACRLAGDDASAVAVLERLGSLLADRLQAPAQAAEAFRDIIGIDPGHGRALRTLRELYAQSGDYESLESLYAQLEQWDELVESFFSIADRLDDRSVRLHLLERAAHIADARFDNPEKIARAYERVLSVDPQNLGAAKALVPVYSRTEKWARLLSTYEVLLEHASDDAERLDLHVKIRTLCEERLGSKALAFQWTARAFEIDPNDAQLLTDLERLAAEADAWQELGQILDRRVTEDNKEHPLGDEQKLHLLRELGKIAMTRLHEPERARAYQEQVMAMSPDDPEAMTALEEIATQLSDWPALLQVYRRRAELVEDHEERVALLFKVAFLEEERVADFDAAAQTYEKILSIEEGSQRALVALAKIQEARGDWGGLASALDRQLAHTGDEDSQVDLLMRLGSIYEHNLERNADALTKYKEALALSTHRSEVHAALERFLVPGKLGGDDELASRTEVAGLLLPIYEDADDPAKIARAIEVLNETAEGAARLSYDRRLVALYGDRLEEPKKAYDAAVRVLGSEPEDAANRAALLRHAQNLGCEEDLAGHFDLALAAGEGVDPVALRELAAELATLYEMRLEQPENAEKAWLKVLELESTDEQAYEALDRIYRASDRWGDLRDLLLRREKTLYEAGLDDEMRKEILLSICDLEESVLDNPEGAMDAYVRVLEIDPTHMRSYKALERLYETAERWRELEDLLGREIDHVDPDADEAEHTQLTFRRARLRALNLSNAEGAVDLLEEVVSRRPGHTDARELLEELMPNQDLRLRIARILEPLYKNDGLWRDLCIVLRAQREFASSPPEAVDLLSRIARVEEEQMSHERGAFDTWVEAVGVEPASEVPRESIRRLASQLDRWEDAAKAYESAVEDTPDTDISLRGELLGELAEIYDRHLADSDRAMSAYQRLLAVDPGNPETSRVAAVALDRLYAEEQRWPDLIDIVRRQAEWADTGEERISLLSRVAYIQEEHLEDKPAAIVTWREVSTEDPDDVRALDALERLFTERGQYPELIEILRRRVERAAEPEAKKEHLARIANLYESELADTEWLPEAINAHLEVLDYLPDDRGTLVELSRLYRTHERYNDLFEILERRLAFCDDANERVDLTYELGLLLREHLDRPNEGLERHAEVLATNPDHALALASIESMLDEEGLRLRAAEVLQPLYETAAEHEKLAGLLWRVAAIHREAGGDPRERLRCLRRVAELREQYLDDKAGAFDAWGDAVRAAVAEPELPELVGNLDRLAADIGKEDALIDIFREVAPDVLDGDLQRRLYLDVADLARALRQDADTAREYYQRVLDASPDDERALNALESIYREAEEFDRLNEILVRKADLAGDNLEARAAALAESATICADQLDRPEDAVMAWEQVLDIAPENRDAAAALEKLYEKGERWHDLVGLIERRLGFAFTVEEAVSLRFRLGEIHEHQLLDPDAAVENYSAVLGGDPGHAGATTALERALDDPGSRMAAAEVLEPIYVANHDWPKLVRIYEIKLEAAESAEERLRLTRYIARLYEEQLEDLDGAFHWYGRVFRESPGDSSIRDQLSRLATILQDWAGLANVYEEYLDDEPGDLPETSAVALALADICDRRTNEVERAQAAYRRVLRANPEDLDTFARLEDLLVRAERWFALVDVYEEAVQSTMNDERRQELYLRMARTQRDQLKDSTAAVDAFRAVLDINADNASAADELDALFQEQNQWFDLSELLAARISRCDDEDQANQYHLRLAEIMEKRLEDVQGAIDHYEIVLKSATGWELALRPLERLVVKEDCRERIAELLEPVYRANDWWQKLVVILDAQLEYVEDPDKQVEMLREIASIHEGRGGDQGLALGALSRAWKTNPASEQVYDELTALAAKLGAWDDLVGTFEEGLKEVYDYELTAKVLARVAEIHETQRSDNTEAIAVWRRVLEVADDDPVALAALDRLLTAEELHEDLVGVLSRRAELADEEGVRKALLHRIAQIYDENLANPVEAIAAYKNVLMVDEADGEALDALDRLYRGEAEWNELASVLIRKIELAADPALRRELHFSAARVYDGELHDAYEAISHLNSVTEVDPQDAEALASLDEIYQRESMWPELVETLDRRAALEASEPARAELVFRAARVIEAELLEPASAVKRYDEVLGLDPSHDGAREALDRMTQNEDTLEVAAEVLERFYRSAGDFEHVAELYERRLAAPSPDPLARREQYAKLVEVHEVSRGDVDAAFSVWSRALAETPEDAEIQLELERLAAARGSWEDLTELYEARLADIVDAELEYAYATKLANLYEEALGDLDRAAEKYRRALDVASDEREPLAALDRIFDRAAKYDELAEILAREAEAVLDEAAQAEFLFRLGDVREQHLEEIPGAVGAYRDVLERSPQHGAARAAMERLLQTAESERSEIIAILEPLYESEEEHGRLTDLLGAKLSVTDDRLDRSLIYARIAELAEQQLNDPVRALDAVGGWLAEDPQSEQALIELDRLAEACGRWGEVAARLSGIIESVDSDDVRRPLLLKLGEVQLDNLGDDAAAEATFQSVLEIDPDTGPALVALDRIYRSRDDAASLAKILWRRGELAFDAEHKRACFVEVAGLRERLEDLPGAVEAWKEVLDLDEGDREAHSRLAAIYEHTEDWPALLDILGVAARFAPEPQAEVALRTRIAEIYTSTPGFSEDKLDEAMDAWQAVLDVAPESLDALLALQRVHVAREDWLSVQEVLVRRLDLAESNAGRIEILLELAQLSVDERDSIDEAIGYLYQILDVDNSHFETYDRLENILVKAERFHDLVELHERRAEVYGALGNSVEEVACLARAADVWEGPLENPDAAGEILEKILKRDPDSVPALTRLAKIYERASDWERCSEVLQRAVALGPTGRDAADLYFRLGEVERQQSGDNEQALRYWAQALQYDPNHNHAVAAFEAEAREREDWGVVADMVTRREAVAQDPEEKLELTLELADLYGKKLKQPEHVIPLLERAVEMAPEDERVLGPLGDLYFAAGDHGRAAPIYEKLAEEAKKSRRMKDVAKYRQRLGGIFEATGETDKALAAYDEAFRVNPTDVATMAGLGRIAMAGQDWQKARRVYRSMVLQNLDPDVGITKAEVYFNLGTIHLELGEANKAKGMFQRGLELEPDNAAIKQALESIK